MRLAYAARCKGPEHLENGKCVPNKPNVASPSNPPSGGHPTAPGNKPTIDLKSRFEGVDLERMLHRDEPESDDPGSNPASGCNNCKDWWAIGCHIGKLSCEMQSGVSKNRFVLIGAAVVIIIVVGVIVAKIR